MNNIEKKALHFVAALMDVYRDEEHRELDAFPKMEFGEDVTDDFTAMLLAMKYVLDLNGDSGETDLIDFTHVLNKLAVQYIMDGGRTDETKTD